MKKFFKELQEQYDYLWWWLLDQGILISTILVNSFAILIFTVVMTAFWFAMRWIAKHH